MRQTYKLLFLCALLCISFVKACQPTTCEAEGRQCGCFDDGCDNIICCGTCGAGSVCNKTTGQCGCISADTCAGRSCGVVEDKCGNTVDCGICGGGSTCNQENGQCECTPFTCQLLGRTCGVIHDGCGGFVQCGECGDSEQCSNVGQCEALGQDAPVTQSKGKRSLSTRDSHIEGSLKQRELALSGAYRQQEEAEEEDDVKQTRREHSSHIDGVMKHREAAMAGQFKNQARRSAEEQEEGEVRRSAGSRHSSHVDASNSHRESAMAGNFKASGKRTNNARSVVDESAGHGKHAEASMKHREAAMAGKFRVITPQKVDADSHSNLFAFFAYGLPVVGILGVVATAFFLVQKHSNKKKQEGYFSIINNTQGPTQQQQQDMSLKSRRSSRHAINIVPSPELRNAGKAIEPSVINLSSSTKDFYNQKAKVGTPRLRVNSPAVQARMSPKISPANLRASQNTFSL